MVLKIVAEIKVKKNACAIIRASDVPHLTQLRVFTMLKLYILRRRYRTQVKTKLPEHTINPKGLENKRL